MRTPNSGNLTGPKDTVLTGQNGLVGEEGDGNIAGQLQLNEGSFSPIGGNGIPGTPL